MASCFFHPEALLEYADSVNYYLQNASSDVAQRFLSSVESSLSSVAADPGRHPVFEEPGIRRCFIRSFPYLLY